MRASASPVFGVGQDIGTDYGNDWDYDWVGGGDVFADSYDWGFDPGFDPGMQAEYLDFGGASPDFTDFSNPESVWGGAVVDQDQVGWMALEQSLDTDYSGIPTSYDALVSHQGDPSKSGSGSIGWAGIGVDILNSFLGAGVQVAGAAVKGALAPAASNPPAAQPVPENPNKSAALTSLMLPLVLLGVGIFVMKD